MFLFRRLIGAVIRAFFRMIGAAIFCALIAAAIVAGVAYEITHQWPPSTLTLVILVAFAVLSAYAGALTVLVGEAVRGIEKVERDIEHPNL